MPAAAGNHLQVSAAAAQAADPAQSAAPFGEVFISYSRRDKEFTERLAAGLSALGCSVWWDHRIGAGEAFDRTIEEAISAARLVLVVWSRHSVASDWVRAEAAFALASNKLLPVSIDSATPPLRFTHIHRLDLSAWDGSQNDRHFKKLVGDIAARLGPAAPAPKPFAPREPDQVEPSAPTSWGFRRGAAWWSIVSALAVALLTLAWIGLRPPAPKMIGRPVPFAEGEVTLSRPTRAALDEQAAFLKGHPEITVIIEGSCTPPESRRGPGVLAQLRANKIRHELIDHYGMAAARIRVAGPAKACDARAPLAVVFEN